jgi:hypothetical protein
MSPYRPLNSVQFRYGELVAEGVLPGVAGTAVGVSKRCGEAWFHQRGGVNPRFGERPDAASS